MSRDTIRCRGVMERATPTLTAGPFGAMLSLLGRALVILGAVVSGALPALPAAGSPAQDNFNAFCGACHTIGGGQRVGPDLKGATERRSREWLVTFITNSQAMIAAGDPDAKALFEKYNKTVMPNAPYSRAQIEEIIDLMAGGGGAAAPAVAAAEVRIEATPEEVTKGQALFQGTQRFANGGAPCLSCHHVSGDTVFGGGVLAKELTDAFSRMGAAGLQGILQAPPFPVMQQAYATHALTRTEINALTAYLQEAGGRTTAGFGQPRENAVKLAFSGLGGFSVLMVLYGAIWRRRKSYPVNHDVFARQVRSE
ncbi:cytochrome c [Candidatus Binatia bacterium]|nr:cytochrome c [Candidatus Binatia bacterium]